MYMPTMSLPPVSPRLITAIRGTSDRALRGSRDGARSGERVASARTGSASLVSAPPASARTSDLIRSGLKNSTRSIPETS